MIHHCLVATTVALLLAGCADDGGAPPDGAPSGATAPAASGALPATAPESDPDVAAAPRSRAARPIPKPDADVTVAEFLGFTAPKPAVWLWHPPETRMRAANYVVPATSGGEQAHLVVFRGIGGGKDANIARWRGQFRETDHTAVEPRITELEADGIRITLLELQGERMKMGDGWYTPDQILLAAIVHDPEGDIHIVLQGQHETVRANHEAFMTFIRGLERQR